MRADLRVRDRVSQRRPGWRLHVDHDEKEETMSDFQAVADRVEIEALRGEFTDAVMMHDHDRVASLFTEDGVWRMPHGNIELAGRDAIREFRAKVPDFLEFLVQNTHPGSITVNGDTASGRAYISELIRTRDGQSMLNYAIYHDRYQRTPDGWKFRERVYETRYEDTTPLTGSAPAAPATPPATAGDNAAANVADA
jgi:ketosteroid isomerase-like protein